MSKFEVYSPVKKLPPGKWCSCCRHKQYTRVDGKEYATHDLAVIAESGLVESVYIERNNVNRFYINISGLNQKELDELIATARTLLRLKGVQ